MVHNLNNIYFSLYCNLLGGGLTLMGFSFHAIGSYENLFVKYMTAIPENIHNISSTTKYIECGIPKENSFQMLRGLSDKEMPWLGFLLGQASSSIWYWCSDQVRICLWLYLISYFLKQLIKR